MPSCNDAEGLSWKWLAKMRPHDAVGFSPGVFAAIPNPCRWNQVCFIVTLGSTGEVAERLKALVSKTSLALWVNVGSNPTLSVGWYKSCFWI